LYSFLVLAQDSWTVSYRRRAKGTVISQLEAELHRKKMDSQKHNSKHYAVVTNWWEIVALLKERVKD
jgi:hypothetical protein